MIDQKMETAINEQINRELYSAYLYFSMAAYFDSISLKGFSNWMRIQAMEEQTHVKRFYDYLTARGGRVLLSDIEAPPCEWDSPLAVFENVLTHEQYVTGLINNLVDLSLTIKDHATNSFLQWFVNEQVEEEASADEVVQSLKLNADNPGGLFLVDKEMAQRMFVQPVDVTI